MTVFDNFIRFLIMSRFTTFPSASKALMVIRSATMNVRNGVAASCGIGTGELIFTRFVIKGLNTPAKTTGVLFAIICFITAGHLIWFGIGLINNQIQ